MGVDYFCFKPSAEVLNFPTSISTSEDFYHIAHNYEELANNIKERKCFKEGQSIESFLEFGDSKTSEDLFKKFEKTIQDLTM